jgi:NADH:ubiquinone oxidoreductase subunit K
VRLFRGTSKAPFAVAGILAVPLFFVALMAFTLKIDKPSHYLRADGTVGLGDPTKGTVATIYLLSLAAAAAVVVVGFMARLLRSRLAVIVPAVAAIVLSILLQLPLNTWAAEHTKRYPLGTDNIRDSTAKKISATNLINRGEWEQMAKTTAHQIGLVTIGLGLAAIAITVLLEIRRRRRGDRPVPVEPPPLELGTGGAPGITGP